MRIANAATLGTVVVSAAMSSTPRASWVTDLIVCSTGELPNMAVIQLSDEPLLQPNQLAGHPLNVAYHVVQLVGDPHDFLVAQQSRWAVRQSLCVSHQ
jgi:hypothetical protein